MVYRSSHLASAIAQLQLCWQGQPFARAVAFNNNNTNNNNTICL